MVRVRGPRSREPVSLISQVDKMSSGPIGYPCPCNWLPAGLLCSAPQAPVLCVTPPSRAWATMCRIEEEDE